MVKFIAKFTMVLVLVYLIVGSLYFSFVTQNYYERSAGLFSQFLVVPEDGNLWEQVIIWMIPFQILRGLLIGFSLFLIKPLLDSKSRIEKTLVVFSLYFTLAGLASVSPGVGNLEGFLFFQSFINFEIHFIILSEIFLQSLFIAFLFSWWIHPKFHQNT